MSVDSPYPEAIITDVLMPDVQQYVDTYDAAHMNDVRAAIRDITAILGINPQGSLATLVARLAVSLANDGKLIFPQQMVLVAKTGGHFNTIQAAINSITDADANKIYTIIICPGTYDESLNGKSYVNLIGTSKEACIVSSSDYNSELSAQSNMAIANLTLEKTGDQGCYVLEINNKSNFKASNCSFKALDTEDTPASINGGSLQFDLCHFLSNGQKCAVLFDDDAQTYNARFTRCYFSNSNIHCLELWASESSQNTLALYDCTLVATGSISISYTKSGSGNLAFRSAHNRMNLPYDGDLVDLITTPYNVLDSDII